MRVGMRLGVRRNVLVRMRRVLAMIMNVLGVIVNVLGGSRSVLGGPCTVLGGFRNVLGGSCNVLGGSCTVLGGSRNVLGVIVNVLGGSRNVLGPMGVTQRIVVVVMIVPVFPVGVIMPVRSVVIVLVRVLVHTELGRGHAGSQDAIGMDVRIAEREAAERLAQIVERQAGVEQGAERHVAGDAGETIEIQDSRH